MNELSVQKLYDDLDYWIHIGIGNDIANLPHHRLEYQHLVKRHKKPENDPDRIAILVLTDLKCELEKPWILRPSLYRLLWLYVSKKLPIALGKKFYLTK